MHFYFITHFFTLTINYNFQHSYFISHRLRNHQTLPSRPSRKLIEPSPMFHTNSGAHTNEPRWTNCTFDGFNKPSYLERWTKIQLHLDRVQIGASDTFGAWYWAHQNDRLPQNSHISSMPSDAECTVIATGTSTPKHKNINKKFNKMLQVYGV